MTFCDTETSDNIEQANEVGVASCNDSSVNL